MAATWASRRGLGDPGEEGLVAVLRLAVLVDEWFGLLPVGEETAKDMIVDKVASAKPLVGVVLVAPPSLLYAEGQNCAGTGEGKVKDWIGLLPADGLVDILWDFVCSLVGHEFVRPGLCVEIK
jgi:hypothetical protein